VAQAFGRLNINLDKSTDPRLLLLQKHDASVSWCSYYRTHAENHHTLLAERLIVFQGVVIQPIYGLLKRGQPQIHGGIAHICIS